MSEKCTKLIDYWCYEVPDVKVENPEQGSVWGWLACGFNCQVYESWQYDWLRDKCECVGNFRNWRFWK